MEQRPDSRIRCCLAGLLLCFAAGTSLHAQRQSAESVPDHEPVALRLAVSDSLPQLDPFLQNTAASNWMLYGNVFEGLVRYEDGEPRPSLAVSWTQEDDLTWVFALRTGVVFHDGSPLIASIVAASFDRALHHSDSAISGRVAQIADVTARDDRHVVIRLRSPSQGFLRGVAMVPIVMHASSTEPLDPLVATGPYRVVDFRKAERLVVDRFADYWGEAPQIARAEFLFESDEKKRVQMLIDGEVVLANHLQPSEIGRIEAQPDLWIESSLGTNLRILVLNTSEPPYSDPRVREAIDLAVDREALVQERYDGYARVAFQLADSKSTGYVPELAARGRDLGRARALVAEAAAGDEIKLQLHCGGPAPPEAEALAAQLREAGFQVELVAIEWSTLYPRMQAGEIPFVYQGWSNYSGDVASTFEEIVHSNNPTGLLGKANHGRYANAEVDRLIEEGMVATDPQRRREIYERASRLVAADRPIIPLVRPLGVFGLRRDLNWAAPSTEAMTLSEMSHEPDR